ncbi:OTU domain-containing protein 6B [Phlyctochytrium bullatum]|nr:OTU domain-containing protein 6B [Phlyctochytrium bullatum]
MADLEEIRSRHRKEAKELAGKITALKKTVSKGAGDKQKKKEVQDQITAMEAELKARHDQELAEAMQPSAPTAAAADDDNDAPPPSSSDDPAAPPTTDADAEPAETTPDSSASTQTTGGGGKKKPNRQKMRKARKAAEQEAQRKQAEEEAANAPNMRELEMQEIERMSAPMGLAVQAITADGHCLYNAISHQLSIRDDEPARPASSIRKIAADYLRENMDRFLPFVAGDLDKELTDDDYQQYCDKVESSALWGGQIEINAISDALKRPIHVVQMNSPIIKVGEEYAGAPLTLSYHRHYFGLGEHYNSLVPTKK